MPRIAAMLACSVNLESDLVLMTATGLSAWAASRAACCSVVAANTAAKAAVVSKLKGLGVLFVTANVVFTGLGVTTDGVLTLLLK